MGQIKVKILRNTIADGKEVAVGGVELVSLRCAGELIAAGKARHLDATDTKPSVEMLRDLHKGKPIAVLGGGPSLPDDLEKVLHLNPILISINHHAALHYSCDAMVFFDSPYKVPILGEGTKHVPITVTPWGDFATHVLDIQYVNYGMTAGLGVWLAELMGASKIMLCGFDCYTGNKRYFYDDESQSFYAEGLAEQLAWWKNISTTIKTPTFSVSGPLLEIFRKFEKQKTRGKLRGKS